jgi:pimeloyl-ACP methyl ester carboxylesterase
MIRALSLVLGWLLVATAAHADMFGPIAGRVHGSGNRALVILAHGDSGPKYLDGFAKSIADSNPGVTVIQMARPGYGLSTGERSKGSNGGGSNHYTKRNNDLLAQGIAAAAKAHPHKKLIAVGHSGGSAQLGTVIARMPGVIDTAILVSGPFDVPRWRAMRGKGAWPSSESAIKVLGSVPASTKIIAATGSSDDNTRPILARDYVAKAKSLGKNATYVEIPGAGHGFRNLQNPVAGLIKQAIGR